MQKRGLASANMLSKALASFTKYEPPNSKE